MTKINMIEKYKSMTNTKFKHPYFSDRIDADSSRVGKVHTAQSLVYLSKILKGMVCTVYFHGQLKK